MRRLKVAFLFLLAIALIGCGSKGSYKDNVLKNSEKAAREKQEQTFSIPGKPTSPQNNDN